jgi:hypothetical protein
VGWTRNREADEGNTQFKEIDRVLHEFGMSVHCGDEIFSLGSFTVAHI